MLTRAQKAKRPLLEDRYLHQNEVQLQIQGPLFNQVNTVSCLLMSFGIYLVHYLSTVSLTYSTHGTR